MIEVDLPPELDELLGHFAKKLGLSKEELAARALAEHIEEFEDLAAAEAALSEDDGEHVSLAEVLAEFEAGTDDKGNPLHAAE